MKLHPSTIRRLLATIVLPSAVLTMAAPTYAGLVHNYDLAGSLADSLGGPSLVANGGTVNASDYSFGPAQGLTLSNASLANPGTYSVLIDFSFDDLTGWRRILDFKNLQSDTGLYNLDEALNFYDIAVGTPAFTPGVPVRLVVTRDNATDLFTGYINGISQFSFNDSGDVAVFDAPNNVMKFFIDDIVVANEESAGRVSQIAIYDNALTASEVAAVGAIPEPGSAIFGLSTLAICLGGRWRRKGHTSS
jgi:hypothetical protein